MKKSDAFKEIQGPKGSIVSLAWIVNKSQRK